MHALSAAAAGPAASASQPIAAKVMIIAFFIRPLLLVVCAVSRDRGGGRIARPRPIPPRFREENLRLTAGNAGRLGPLGDDVAAHADDDLAQRQIRAARQLQRLLDAPAQAAAAGHFHPHHGDAGDPAVLEDAGELVDDEALLAELRALDDDRAVLEKAPLEVAEGHGRAVGRDEQVLPLEKRRRRRHELELDRPVAEFGTDLARGGLRRGRGAIVADEARRRAAAAVVTVACSPPLAKGGMRVVSRGGASRRGGRRRGDARALRGARRAPEPARGRCALRCSSTTFSSKPSASRSSIVIAPSGHSPRQAPRPSHRFSATSRALPSMTWIAPSAQLGTQSPQPLHLSASISTILRFMSVSSRRPWRPQ